VSSSDLDSMYRRFGITDEVRAGLVALAKMGPSVYAESSKLAVETVIIVDGKRTIVNSEAPGA